MSAKQTRIEWCGNIQVHVPVKRSTPDAVCSTPGATGRRPLQKTSEPDTHDVPHHQAT